MSNDFSRSAEPVVVEVRSTDQGEQIVIMRPDTMGDDHDEIHLTPEQIPLLIEWLEEAAIRANGTSA